MVSRYQAHVEKWKDCRACKLCDSRSQIVPFGGDVPCDVLFLGEAPGSSEDSLGEPFIGPAGDVLKEEIKKAIKVNGLDSQVPKLRLGFTNLVLCYPRDETGVKNYRNPSAQEIEACFGRLCEIVHICNPKVVALVGKLAQKRIVGQADFGGKYDPDHKDYKPTDEFLKFFHVLHPGAIFQADQTQRGLLRQRVFSDLDAIFSNWNPF